MVSKMQVKNISYPFNNTDFTPVVCAIGSFDGVHLGHQEVINTAKLQAEELGVASAVIIFEPHPLFILDTSNTPQRITPLVDKLLRIEEQGVDICYIFEFSRSFAELSSNDFVESVLSKMNLKGVVVGFDFRYGKHGAGNALTLQSNADIKQLFTVTVVEAYLVGGSKVSSSRIRKLLIAGKIREANKLLGQEYTFIGKVVGGEKRGRKLGFPTMNIELAADYISLQNGVYVVETVIDGDYYYGVMNVGTKPTFYDKITPTTYEIHLIDFSQNVYGKTISVIVLDYLRAEKRFSSVKCLVDAIEQDIEQARLIISLHLKG